MSNANRDALRHFFVLGYHELRARLTRRLGSAELAGDVLHETWLRIERAQSIGTVQSPKHYLLQVAANVAAKQRASESRLVTLSDAKTAIGLADDIPSPERAAIDRSEVEALARVLGELTPRRREVLLASRLNGEPTGAIAKRLGISQRLVELELRDALAHCALRLERTVGRKPRNAPVPGHEGEDPA